MSNSIITNQRLDRNGWEAHCPDLDIRALGPTEGHARAKCIALCQAELKKRDKEENPEYVVVFANAGENIETLVRAQMDKGYMPQGGIAVDPHTEALAQAMMRKAT